MAQVYFITTQFSLAANGSTNADILTKLQSQKRIINRIFGDSQANVTVQVNADQLQVMNMDSQHFPSNGEGLPLEIDLTNYSVVNAGITNNTGGAVTYNLTIQYTQG